MMEILFYSKTEKHPEIWLDGMKKRLPNANIRQWQPNDNAAADYALVWLPPFEMLSNRSGLKGILTLSAGVDAVLQQEQEHPGTLPKGVPVIRLEDSGMASLMAEYALARVLYYFRRFDDYQKLQQQKTWQALDAYSPEDFTIGVLGAGALGLPVAKHLAQAGFPVKSWSRTPKKVAGIACYSGQDALADFLTGTRVLINLLPNTPQTVGILNQHNLGQLEQGAYLINIARGAHLVDNDLLLLLQNKHIKAASLDVFHTEPLSAEHPFWTEPNITITPHVSAPTVPELAMDAIAANIIRMETGQIPTGLVDCQRGY